MEDLRGGLLALEHYYEISTLLGRSALGRRYRAMQKPLAKPVTIWSMERLTEMGASPKLLERIKRSAWRASRLTHQNNLHIVDYGQLESKVPFIVTEDAATVSLRELISTEGSLSPARTLHILRQLSEALDDAYRYLLPHGGLSSYQVLIEDPGGQDRVKLFGYGMGLRRTDLFILDQAMFSTELVCHLPPEAFDTGSDGIVELQEHQGEKGFEKALSVDVYGLGTIAYECLTGMHPYFRHDRDASDGVLSLLRETPPGLHESFGILEELDVVVFQALARNPETRQANPALFVADFEEALPEDPALSQTVITKIDDEESRALRWYESLLLGLSELAPRRLRQALSRPGARRLATVALIVTNIITVIALLQTAIPNDSAEKEVVFTPPAPSGEGVDLVFLPVEREGLEVHVVAKEGETASLGHPPYLLRDQAMGGRVRFVLMEKGQRPRQIEVFVEDPGGQVMFIDMERWLERPGKTFQSAL